MITRLEEFKVLGDHRGQLVALEANKQIPFDVKRVFYIYGTQEGIPRGNHSHYKTKQFLVAVNGSCKVTLDNGKTKETFDLNKPNLGLFQDALIWGTMHDFSSDCVLMVLANEYYDASDYIIDYDKFLEEVRNDS
ncbi:sugar 3,4-ketoisomerase [Arcobacter ellisii]|uniref:WxcM-like domain-containing protein n=1 Tax=Arcobacter ellisii TaxID=913109 RepID=A0A347UAL9_9BACT|nr:FdtA/QdtA family cupin domain-containing protein [Arcobacter ellisii]AXX95897.1 WxcM-like domain-containing protein [Arcobacter ellisii]RXI29755.1 dTDP-6-deoxy-3,4-keto-hexulose isomerase [Arcobacter ellisii]